MGKLEGGSMRSADRLFFKLGDFFGGDAMFGKSVGEYVLPQF